MEKNDEFEIQITGMTSEGAGVGRAPDGTAVFVPMTAVGDTVEVHVIKTAKSYAAAILKRIIKPSDDRIMPDCPVFKECGGCVYRHVTYESECRYKHLRVADAFKRIGGFDISVSPIKAAKNPDRYRNKTQLPVGINPSNGEISVGFYASRSHRIINCPDCRLQPEIFGKAAEIIKAHIKKTGISVYDELTGKGAVRHIYIRYAKHSNTLMVCPVLNGNGLPDEELLAKKLEENLNCKISFVVNSNREKTNVVPGRKFRVSYGSDRITDRLCGLDFELSPASFYQVNTEQAEVLYTLAAEYADLSGSETVLDLYCGTGTIGLSLAKNAKQIIGAEIVAEAVENARQNADRNNIKNAEFICADAIQAAKKLTEDKIHPDVIILDPPRKGCDKELLEAITELNPKKIVYISCNPETCARDAKILCENDRYILQKITPVDMFPRTSHVETVVLLTQDCSTQVTSADDKGAGKK